MAGHKVADGTTALRRRMLQTTGLLGGVALLALLHPTKALADCTVTAGGSVDCTSATTTGTTNNNGAAASSIDFQQLYNTGVPITAVVEPAALLDGWGLRLTQLAPAPQTISVVNNGSVFTANPASALEVDGNGGLITYSGNGSGATTNTTPLFSGVALFNRDGGGVNVGSALTPVTGNFSGGVGLYVGVPGGSADIFNGAQTIYLSGGSATSIIDAEIGIFGDARSGNGDVFIRTTGGTVVSTTLTGFGIDAHTGGGSATLISDAMIGTAGARVGTGQRSAVDFGAGGVIANQTGGAIFANTNGIYASTGGTGSVAVAMSGGSTISAVGPAANGILATGTTGPTTVNLTSAGTSITASGAASWGINGQSATGSIGVTLAGGTSVTGMGGALTFATTSGAVTVTNAGTLNSGGGLLASTVIRQTGGAFALTNSAGGVINGSLNLNATTGANTLTNAGLWNTSGTNSFGTAANTLTNTGVINVTGAASFTRLTTFNDTGGLLDLRQNVIGQPGLGNSNPGGAVTGNVNADSVTTSGAFTGGNLGLNVFLGGPASTADQLHVQGAISGTTTLLLADTSTGVGGYTGAAGIPLVTVAGANTASAVAISPSSHVIGGGYRSAGGVGVLRKGLFDYVLSDTAGTYALVSLPGQVVSETPVALTGAKSIWYETATDWDERQTHLRGGFTMGVIMPSGEAHWNPNSWMSASGSWTQRKNDTDAVVGTTALPLNLSYHQDVYSLTGGFDFNRTWGGARVQVGVMAGYVGGRTDFNADNPSGPGATRIDYSGGLIGVSGSYVKDRWFVSGLIKADLLRVTFGGGTGYDEAHANATTWGGLATGGYHFTHGGVFIEPMVSLAATTTHMGHLDIPLADVNIRYDRSDTFRGGVGVRIGNEVWSDKGHYTEVSMTGRLWNQFSGDDSSVTVANSGTAFDLTDRFGGTFGEVSGRVDCVHPDRGLTAFVSAGVKFNSRYTDTTAGLGLLYRW